MVVLDSSSLILMAKSGMLDIALNSISEPVCVPEAVVRETTGATHFFDAQLIKAILDKNKMQINIIKNGDLVLRIMKDFRIARGEAEAIVLASEKKESIIIDDKKGMNACRVLEVQFTTALKLLVVLYLKGAVSKLNAEAICQKLVLYGRYSHDIVKIAKGELQWE